MNDCIRTSLSRKPPPPCFREPDFWRSEILAKRDPKVSISKGESRPQAGKFWHFEGPKTPIPKGESPRKWFRNGPDLSHTTLSRKRFLDGDVLIEMKIVIGWGNRTGNVRRIYERPGSKIGYARFDFLEVDFITKF